jgi:beta-galactosidase
MWRLAYAPGVLRAVARRGGAVVATSEVKTAGAPARIALVPDRATIRADGKDLSFVTVTVLDHDGVPVPTADNLIRLRVSGGAQIAAVDNGDEISHAPFRSDRVRLFNGKGLVIVRAARRGGTATVTATSAGLRTAATRIALRRPR